MYVVARMMYPLVRPEGWTTSPIVARDRKSEVPIPGPSGERLTL
jgi:hypothetical protein